jgi:hypothetical protein
MRSMQLSALRARARALHVRQMLGVRGGDRDTTQEKTMTEEVAKKCMQAGGCDAPVAYSFVWPGKEKAYACTVHALNLASVAKAMGLDEKAIALTPEKQTIVRTVTVHLTEHGQTQMRGVYASLAQAVSQARGMNQPPEMLRGAEFLAGLVGKIAEGPETFLLDVD